MSIKALIIDDEEDARENLTTLLSRHCPQIDRIIPAASISKAVEEIRKEKPDLLFLDVLMPERNGFDLFSEIDSSLFKIIITSAHSEFALKAIKCNALDYLLKPIDVNELKTAVGKALKLPVNGSEQTEKIILQHRGQQLIRKRQEILYCEADSNYTIFHFSNQEKLVASKTLKEYEQQFGQDFIRVHSKFLVNLNEIKTLTAGKDFIELKNGTLVPVSRRKKTDIFNFLFQNK